MSKERLQCPFKGYSILVRKKFMSFKIQLPSSKECLRGSHVCGQNASQNAKTLKFGLFYNSALSTSPLLLLSVGLSVYHGNVFAVVHMGADLSASSSVCYCSLF